MLRPSLDPMSTAPRPHLQSLEALRGIAALIVLLHHALGMVQNPRYYGTPLLGDVFSVGQLGVDIFFVLSGFMMVYTNPGDHQSPFRLARYLFHRLSRIYPLYWVVCAVYVPALFLIPGTGPAHLERSWGETISGLLLLPWKHDPQLGVAWTLRFEVMFYLFFLPFLVRRWLGWGFWAFLAAMALWNMARPLFPGSPWLEQAVSFRLLEFLAGVVTCSLLDAGSGEGRGCGWLVAAGLGIILTMVAAELRMGAESLPWRGLGYACGASLLLAGLVRAERAGSLAVPAPLVTLGICSYAVYLVHFPAQQVLMKVMLKVTGPSPGLVVVHGVALAVAALSLASGLAVSRFVEQPLLRWSRRFAPKPA